MREYKVTLPLTKEELKKYEIGDVLYLTGYIYTARDAAHKRFQQLVEEGKPLPVDLKGQIIFYAVHVPRSQGERWAPSLLPPACAWTAL